MPVAMPMMMRPTLAVLETQSALINKFRPLSILQP